MNYTHKTRKPYASASTLFKIGIAILVVSIASYGFLVVGVVKAAAHKQQFSERQAEIGAELNMLEQELLAIKSGVSKADPSQYALSDVTANRSIIDTHSLGMAFVSR